MWFDTHCHLYDVDDPSAAIERARSAGVEGMLIVGVDPDSSRRALGLTGDGVWSGAAWHPTSVKGWDDSWTEPIEALLADRRVRAVGESGIDLYWDKAFLADQVAALKAHICLSKRYDKALVLHTRDSVDETIAVLREEGPPPRLIFHCWSGNSAQLTAALGLGAYVSFAGNVTFKSASALRELSRAVPDDRILIETDSPYLAPVPFRGKPNEPSYVVHTGEVIAAERGIDAAVLAEITTANSRTILGL